MPSPVALPTTLLLLLMLASPRLAGALTVVRRGALAAATAARRVPAPPMAAASRSEFASLTVPQLKKELSERGLPVSGRKDVLLDRLVGAPAAADGTDDGGGSRSSRRRSSSSRSRSSSSSSSSGSIISSSSSSLDDGGGSGSGHVVMVVESPAKCKTLAKFCGDDYVVLASNGHIRQLPSKPNSVRPDEGFDMSFDLVPGATGVLRALGQALKGARMLLLATDPDREGEAIAWHLAEALAQKGHLRDGLAVRRISFSEITESAVKAALAAPRDVNLPLVRAQQARQAVDYLVGFTLSPVLWRKLPGCRSAGRVQSVALRLIVEREREIQAFVPREYWRLRASLAPPAEGGDGAGALLAEITHVDGARLRQFDVADEDAARATMARMPSAWRVDKVKRTKRQTGPPPPYNTASLQQDASRRLGMGVGRVMRLAQSLYEGVALDGDDGESTALITYMRTDGIGMSDDGIEGARAYIAAAFGGGPDVLPPSPRVFKKKARNAQESHEAIRPIAMERTPASLRGKVGDAELRLYELIWRRAVASQMANAVHEQLAITLHPDVTGGADQEAADTPLAEARASGSRVLLEGYKAVYSMPSAVPKRTEADADDDEEEDDEDDGSAPDEPGGTRAEGQGAASEEDAGALNPLLASLAEGDILGTAELLPSQHFTEPPPRFSEGSLVR